jgi:hypothetical protein
MRRIYFLLPDVKNGKSIIDELLLKRVERAIEKGELLMMVDAGKDRVEVIEALVKSRHPEADIEGTDPTIPAFP